MSGLGRPGDMHLAVLFNAVAQVEVDQALVGHAGVACHDLEMRDHVFRQAHGDGLLSLDVTGPRRSLTLGMVDTVFMVILLPAA